MRIVMEFILGILHILISSSLWSPIANTHGLFGASKLHKSFDSLHQSFVHSRNYLSSALHCMRPPTSPRSLPSLQTRNMMLSVHPFVCPSIQLSNPPNPFLMRPVAMHPRPRHFSSCCLSSSFACLRNAFSLPSTKSARSILKLELSFGGF
jgi:hypothetical protein